MVDIKDLTINRPKSFKIKTRNLGELEFANPTMKHVNSMIVFANSRKAPKTAFLGFLNTLLINPKKCDLSKLSDAQLKKIGMIFLKTQGLHGKYEKIKRKHRLGNFYEKNKKLYKDYVRDFNFDMTNIERQLNSLNVVQAMHIGNILNQYNLANRFAEINRVSEAERSIRELIRASQSTFELLQRNEIKRSLELVQSTQFHEFEKISAQYLLKQQEHIEFIENLTKAYAPYSSIEAFMSNLNASVGSFERELRSQTFIIPPSIISETFDFIQNYIDTGIFEGEKAKKDASDIQQLIDELRTQSFDCNDLDMTESQVQKYFIDCVFIIAGLIPHLVVAMDPSAGVPPAYLLDTILFMLRQMKERFVAIRKEQLS